MNLLYGSNADPVETATTFVRNHNGLPDAERPWFIFRRQPAMREPWLCRSRGDQPGADGFHPVSARGGRYPQRTARAVAGGEAVTSGDGVAVLNPYRTGLQVGGQATLEVEGTVIVNSRRARAMPTKQPVGMMQTTTPAGPAAIRRPMPRNSTSSAGSTGPPISAILTATVSRRSCSANSCRFPTRCSTCRLQRRTMVWIVMRGSPSTNQNMSAQRRGGENRVVTQFTTVDPDRFRRTPI